MPNVLILYTLRSDASKCAAVASNKYSGSNNVVYQQVQFKDGAEIKFKNNDTIRKTYRLSDTTIAFVRGQASRRIDTLIWVSHAAPSRLMADGRRISLSDIAAMILVLRPTVVTFISCNFALASSKPIGRDAVGGPYETTNSLEWLAGTVACRLPDNHKLVINGSTSTTMASISPYSYSKSLGDVHLIVESFKVASVRATEVEEALSPSSLSSDSSTSSSSSSSLSSDSSSSSSSSSSSAAEAGGGARSHDSGSSHGGGGGGGSSSDPTS